MLKDAFKQVWTYTYRKCADKCLTGWIGMAYESGIAELERFAGGPSGAKEQILNFCQHRITSARIEAFNTLVSRVTHKACGVSDLSSSNSVSNHCEDDKAPEKRSACV